MGHDPQGTESTAARTTPDGRGQTGRTPSETDALTRALDVLAHPRRRAALTVLQDAGWLSLDALAQAVVARCDTAAVGDGSSLERVRLELHHVHLPKLDAADVVTYDPADGQAVCTVEDDLLTRLLDDVAFVER